jgi:hypothetical protein
MTRGLAEHGLTFNMQMTKLLFLMHKRNYASRERNRGHHMSVKLPKRLEARRRDKSVQVVRHIIVCSIGLRSGEFDGNGK